MTSPYATNRPLLTIISNADENFMPGLEVAVASTVGAASGKFDYRFLILDGGLTRKSVAELGKVIARLAELRGITATMDLLPVDQSRLQALPARRGSRMTYAKMVLPEMLAHLDEVIYLDADVLCFNGVESILPSIRKPNWLLAGARDYIDVIENDCPWIEQVADEERQLPYINCGVMGMNLKGLREIDFTSRSIVARAAIPDVGKGDQAVFNFLCRGRSHILPDAINHRTSIGSARLLCEGDLDLNIHYIGSPKPWLGVPKASTWLAHCLWHQARKALIPGAPDNRPLLPPHDQASIRRKSLLYSVLNPSRAKNYRIDLQSLKDPANILAKAKDYWSHPHQS